MTPELETMFQSLSKKELYQIYQDIQKSKEDGLRPHSLDTYIQKIQQVYPLNAGQAWRYTENIFFTEIADRFFKEK